MFPTLSLLRHSALIAMLAMVLASACAAAAVAAEPSPTTTPEPAPVTGQQEADPEADASETNRSLEIIRDCNDDGVLQGRDSYSAEDLERARRELASDVAQYSDCHEVITAALHRKSRGGGGGAAPSSDEIAVSPEQRARFESVLAQEIARGKSVEKPRIPIDGQTIVPGSGSTFTSNAKPGTPFSLFVIAALCLLAALPGIYGAARVLIARRGWQPRLPSPGGIGALRFPRNQPGTRD